MSLHTVLDLKRMSLSLPNSTEEGEKVRSGLYSSAVIHAQASSNTHLGDLLAAQGKKNFTSLQNCWVSYTVIQVWGNDWAGGSQGFSSTLCKHQLLLASHFSCHLLREESKGHGQCWEGGMTRQPFTKVLRNRHQVTFTGNQHFSAPVD